VDLDVIVMLPPDRFPALMTGGVKPGLAVIPEPLKVGVFILIEPVVPAVTPPVLPIFPEVTAIF
jgi:hypothetical protein